MRVLSRFIFLFLSLSRALFIPIVKFPGDLVGEFEYIWRAIEPDKIWI